MDTTCAPLSGVPDSAEPVTFERLPNGALYGVSSPISDDRPRGASADQIRGAIAEALASGRSTIRVTGA